MLSLTSPEHILCLGAHCDDIEIGCGGALLELAERFPAASVHCVVLSSNEVRSLETKSALQQLCEGFSNLSIDVKTFRNGFFPDEWAKIKTYFESLKTNHRPDLIFTHYGKDLHQDHATVASLSWNTFRDHLILEYEIPKWDPDIGNPNVLVPIKEENARKKTRILSDCFASQRAKHWFDSELFLGLMRLRGMHAATTFAEGFYSRKAKVVLDLQE